MTVRTLADYLPALSAGHGGRPAVITVEEELSYDELASRSAALAGGLIEAGLGRGERVVTMLPNGIDAAIATHAVLRSGAALVPLSDEIKPQRLAYVLADVRPSAVLCRAEHQAAVEQALAGAAAVPVITDLAAAERPQRQGALPTTLGDDLAAILYTSGSTGKPKGVMLTHHNLAFATDSIVEYLRIGAEDRILCVLQLSFGYGLSQLLCCARAGAALILAKTFAMPGTVVQLLEDQRVTGLPGVPTVFQVLLGLDGIAERKLPDLRFLTNAGAALPATAATALRALFPRAELYSMYGLTECVRATYLEPDQLELRPTSSGKAIPGTEAWVRTSSGAVAAPGEVGELVVRGPHVMQGYWDDPESTAARLGPGRWPWVRELATGDLFRCDGHGYLFWVGRTDDLIKSRGEKVYPREVEDVLHAHEAIGEAAVLGAPDRLLGQLVVAHVAPLDGAQIDPREVRRHCAAQLEPHMVPRRVHLHDRLPRTDRGKVDRDALLALDSAKAAPG